MSKKLEEEAKTFQKKKSPQRSSSDIVALRFYMGQALSGLLARGFSNRPEEVIRESFEYALLAEKYEKENF